MSMGAPRTSSGKGVFVFLAVLGAAGVAVGSFALNYALRRTHVDEEALLHGSLIGGVGLLLLSIAIAKLLNRGLAVVLLLGGVAGGYVWAQQGLSRQADNQAVAAELTALYDAIQPVCSEGVTLAEATVYDGEPGLHPTVMYNQGSDGGWYALRNTIPDEWVPTSVEETQLVVCVVTSRQVHESCSYSVQGGTRLLSRVQYHRDLTIKEALTGRVIDSARVSGTVPSACPEQASFQEHEYSRDQTGTLPSDEGLLAAVREWIDVSL